MLIDLIRFIVGVLLCLSIIFCYVYSRKEYYDAERFERRLDQLNLIATVGCLLIVILMILTVLSLLQK